MAKSPVAIDPSTNKFIYDYVEVKIDEKTHGYSGNDWRKIF